MNRRIFLGIHQEFRFTTTSFALLIKLECETSFNYTRNQIRNVGKKSNIQRQAQKHFPGNYTHTPKLRCLKWVVLSQVKKYGVKWWNGLYAWRFIMLLARIRYKWLKIDSFVFLLLPVRVTTTMGMLLKVQTQTLFVGCLSDKSHAIDNIALHELNNVICGNRLYNLTLQIFVQELENC